MTNIVKAQRVSDGKWITGYYWNVEEHSDPTMSGKHYIKSMNNGSDFEIDIKTIRHRYEIKYKSSSISPVISVLAFDGDSVKFSSPDSKFSRVVDLCRETYDWIVSTKPTYVEVVQKG